MYMYIFVELAGVLQSAGLQDPRGEEERADDDTRLIDM